MSCSEAGSQPSEQFSEVRRGPYDRGARAGADRDAGRSCTWPLAGARCVNRVGTDLGAATDAEVVAGPAPASAAPAAASAGRTSV
ncbi:hypothetical protein ACLVWQ_12220 [Streptomyces sp. CWNU-52B]|uniref:hypothetical protein n=1 Tax=unclassified Streptomyces TaxID=2593676 RepID=UPI0039C1A188